MDSVHWTDRGLNFRCGIRDTCQIWPNHIRLARLADGRRIRSTGEGGTLIGNDLVTIEDATPGGYIFRRENACWTTFLNQDTPIFRGTETIARRLNFPVVFLSTKKIKRGFYRFNMELLFENPEATKSGEITKTHTKRLEQDIQVQLEIRLWSHRRWKHGKSWAVRRKQVQIRTTFNS